MDKRNGNGVFFYLKHLPTSFSFPGSFCVRYFFLGDLPSPLNPGDCGLNCVFFGIYFVPESTGSCLVSAFWGLFIGLWVNLPSRASISCPKLSFCLCCGFWSISCFLGLFFLFVNCHLLYDNCHFCDKDWLFRACSLREKILRFCGPFLKVTSDQVGAFGSCFCL